MDKWEYAEFCYDHGAGGTRRVAFSHTRPVWEPIAKNEFFSTLRRLGDEG